MDPAPDALPDDVAALKAALIAERAKRLEVAAELAVARAKASEDMALIAAQKLRIAKLERQIYGQRSERSERLIEQLSLTFEELAANATEDELAAEQAVAKATNVRAFTRRGAERDTFPDHLPRERVVMDPPTACECCGGTRLRKLGEDVTRTLETSPRLWKVIETVREKFSCRDCDQPGAGAVPCHSARVGGPELAGDDRVREVRAASTVEPAGRALRAGGRADRAVDHGRRGRRRLRNPRSASTPHRGPCDGG